MAMPLHSVVVPSFFMNDHVQTVREDGYERLFNLNPDGCEPFKVIVTVWPELRKTVLQAKDSLGEPISVTLAYDDSDFNLVYYQLHVNWYALMGMITAGVVRSL